MGVALANPNQGPATVTLALADDTGHTLATPKTLIIQAHSHFAPSLQDLFPDITGSRGAVSFTSDAPIFGLAIRTNGMAFTSLKTITK